MPKYNKPDPIMIINNNAYIPNLPMRKMRRFKIRLEDIFSSNKVLTNNFDKIKNLTMIQLNQIQVTSQIPRIQGEINKMLAKHEP